MSQGHRRKNKIALCFATLLYITLNKHIWTCKDYDRKKTSKNSHQFKWKKKNSRHHLRTNDADTCNKENYFSGKKMKRKENL